jgi:hypothetical protein
MLTVGNQARLRAWSVCHFTTKKLRKFLSRLAMYMTLYVKREAFMLEFFAYEEIGGSIGNVASVTRADFI